MREAVYVSVLGMSVVFVALTIVLLVTLALERLFRVRPQAVECAPDTVGAGTPEEDDLEVAAAIGAALAIVAAESDQELPPTPVTRVLGLDHESPGWRAAGRLASMH